MHAFREADVVEIHRAEGFIPDMNVRHHAGTTQNSRGCRSRDSLQARTGLQNPKRSIAGKPWAGCMHPAGFEPATSCSGATGVRTKGTGPNVQPQPARRLPIRASVPRMRSCGRTEPTPDTIHAALRLILSPHETCFTVQYEAHTLQGCKAGMSPETSFDQERGVLTLRFGSSYIGAAGQRGILDALRLLTSQQRQALRAIILDCSHTTQADLDDSDGAKLQQFRRQLADVQPGLGLQETQIVVVATHPMILDRYRRQKTQSLDLYLVESLEEARELTEPRL